MKKSFSILSVIVSTALISAPVVSCSKQQIVHVDSIEIDHYVSKDLYPGTQYNCVPAGSSIKLEAKVLPENASDKSLTWVSSDPSVAQVDQDGNVKGIKQGYITLTAQANDNQKKHELFFFVYEEETKATHIQITTAPTEATVDGYYDVEAKIYPAKAIQQVKWISVNEEVATIESTSTTTAKIHALKAGTTIIYASNYDGSVNQTFVLNVSSVLVSSITLDKQTYAFDLAEGQETIQLNPTVLPQNATDKSLTWKSSDTTVATVDENGLVTRISSTAGDKATITATAKDGSGITTSAVVKVVDNVVPLEKITVEDQTITEGKTTTLPVSFIPTNASIQDVSYTSLDESIVTVDNTGKITALRPGETTITIVPADKSGGATAVNCKITVTADPELITSITLDKDEYYLNIASPGPEVIVNPTIEPETALDNYTFTIKDESIATIDQTGKLQPLSVGETTIKAVSNDWKHVESKESKIIVSDEVLVNRVVIEQENFAINLNNPQTHIAKAKVEPEEATNPNVNWYSTNEKVVTIDKTTGKITPKGIAGTAQIYACSTDGTLIWSNPANVYVGFYTPVESIDLDDTEITIKQNITWQLTPTIKPAQATIKKVFWQSEDPKIATVDINGVVNGVSPGTTNIVVTSIENPSISKTCQVTVLDQLVTDIRINPSSVQFEIGQKKQLTATVYPKEACQTVKWYSNKPGIVSVDEQTGEITANATGKAVITAVSTDEKSTVFGTCNVTVTDYYVPITRFTTNVDKINFDIFSNDEQSQEIVATISPSIATDLGVTCTESRSGIVNVDKVEGKLNTWKVSPIKPGETYLTFTTDGKNEKGERESKKIPVSVFDRKTYVKEISITNKLLTPVPKGDSFLMKTEIKPDNAFNKRIEWTSSDENVAKIDNDTSILTTVGTGDVEITVKALGAESGKIVKDKFILHVREYECKDFHSCSWDYIAEACNDLEDTWDGKEFDSTAIYTFINRFKVKGQKPTSLNDFIGARRYIGINNREHEVRVIDFAHDEICDEYTHKVIGKAALSFELSTILSDVTGNTIFSKASHLTPKFVGYPASPLRWNISGSIYDVKPKYTWDKTAWEMLPSDLKNVVKCAKKYAYISHYDFEEGHIIEPTVFYDKIYALSKCEVDHNYPDKNEGKKYPFYYSDRLAKKNGQGNKQDYWLTSFQYRAYGRLFWFFGRGYNGLLNDTVPDAELGVFFAFCI